MKQTALEWLIKELEEQKLIKLDKLSTILFNKNFATRYELIIEEAKAMLYKELKEAWNDGYKKAQQDIVTNSFSTFEQYQNEKNG
jgi:hypothetical protein